MIIKLTPETEQKIHEAVQAAVKKFGPKKFARALVENSRMGMKARMKRSAP